MHDSTLINDMEDFLCIIKKSHYKMVNQLNQTPSKISKLSLLRCSEAHKYALVKFLRDGHVPQEIFVCQFEGVVNNIAANISLGLSDDELPPEGRNHYKALHISIECVDTILSRVLVDTGSSLNILTKSSLSKLTIEGLMMKPSELIARAFDVSRRMVICEVEPILSLSLSLSSTFIPLIVVFMDDLGFTHPELTHRLSTKG